jgi:hypothetical protein
MEVPALNDGSVVVLVALSGTAYTKCAQLLVTGNVTPCMVLILFYTHGKK